MRTIIIVLLGVVLLTSCGKNLNEGKIMTLLDEKNIDEGAEWWYLKLSLGKVTVRNEVNRDNSHSAEAQTLCRTSMTNTETGEEANLYFICRGCPGCLECLNKFKEAGLVDYTTINESHEGTLVDVSLTNEGKKWVFISEPNFAYLKYAKLKTLNVFDLSIEENRASCKYTSCFYELTPFAKSLGNEDGKARIYSTDKPEELREDFARLVYYEDKGWALDE